jgi:hypothetical protein
MHSSSLESASTIQAYNGEESSAPVNTEPKALSKDSSMPEEMILTIAVAASATLILVIIVVFVVLRMRGKRIGDNESAAHSGSINDTSSSGTPKAKLKLIMKLDSGGFGEVCS